MRRQNHEEPGWQAASEGRDKKGVAGAEKAPQVYQVTLSRDRVKYLPELW
jgi:hypothetical protein